MERSYLEYIRKFLGETAEMKPIRTSLKPHISRDGSIKAIVFDIYGTILISASGDIDESVISTENLKLSFEAAGIEINKNLVDTKTILVEILETFKRTIKDQHLTKRTNDRPYPEIDILKIWEEIVLFNSNRKNLILNGPLCIKGFTFIFEVLSNRIYPMPGMKEVINQIAKRNLPLGIISNAQFYTPVILNYILHDTVSENEQVAPFDNDLTVFSYKYKRSKPDTYLFKLLKNKCKQKYGIQAHEILFIGNDMFRDIYPARLMGFKTALFAGDDRSLRLRQDMQELNAVTPDFVLTDLNQLLKIIE